MVYYGAATTFGIYGVVGLALLVYNCIQILFDMSNNIIREQFIIPIIYLRVMILFVIIGHALPIIWTFSFRKTIEMLTSVVSYLFYAPTYINILQVFSFCRIDDLSWGTKGLDTDETVKTADSW
jgi:chitin synthase